MIASMAGISAAASTLEPIRRRGIRRTARKLSGLFIAIFSRLLTGLELQSG